MGAVVEGGKRGGGEKEYLQLDITRYEPIDDNRMSEILHSIVDHSFNIHEDGSRLVFRKEENLRTKLKADARNPKCFPEQQDQKRLADEIRYVLIGGEDSASRRYHVIVLREHWESQPWQDLQDHDRPEYWLKQHHQHHNPLRIVVLPQRPEPLHERLGRWLQTHVTEQRNSLRFLMDKNMDSLYHHEELIHLARVIYLADQYANQTPSKDHAAQYRQLKKDHQKELHAQFSVMFPDYAVLRSWNYTQPEQCLFTVESRRHKGREIDSSGHR